MATEHSRNDGSKAQYYVVILDRLQDRSGGLERALESRIRGSLTDGRKEDMKGREKRDGTKIGVNGILKGGPCYESPREERVSHAFTHLISNIKSYNGVKI